MVRVVWVVLSLMLAVCSAHAADIQYFEGRGSGLPSILVFGQIMPGDDEKFERLAAQINQADVYLASPGGDARAGLAIAKAVNLRGYTTVVLENAVCASMCSIVWISGKYRFLFPTSQVGFHAAYRMADGSESGEVNGAIAIHLYQLGLLPGAIRWMQREGPSGMSWLTPEIAREFSIAFGMLPVSIEQTKPVANMVDPASPTSNFDTLADRDIFGFDLGDAKKSLSESDCASTCSRTRNCNAYTYNRPNSLCYLKSGGKEVMWNKNAASGYVSSLGRNLKFLKITIVNSTKLEGKTYRVTTGTDLTKCASTCDGDNSCTGFEFERQPKAECRLKSGTLKRVKKPRLTSGIKTAE